MISSTDALNLLEIFYGIQNETKTRQYKKLLLLSNILFNITPLFSYRTGKTSITPFVTIVICRTDQQSCVK